MLCDYGCKREVKHQFKNGKWCCESNWKRCPIHIEKMRVNNPLFDIEIRL